MFASREGKTHAETICIVDDDASLRRSVSNLLRSLGFQVEAFESAEAFLLSDQRRTTGCLVLDQRLPGLNGFELLARLRSEASTIRVVMLTAHGDDDLRRRAIALGVVAFLAKPFRPEDLLQAIQACLGRVPRA